MYSVVEEIDYKDPNLYFASFCKEPYAVFLDSADYEILEGATNRYSYILIEPFEIYIQQDMNLNPFVILKEKLSTFQLKLIPDLPPFQGGVAGFFSYDLCHPLDGILCDKKDFDFPQVGVGFYDVVISFDHLKQKAWVISSGLPEENLIEREKKAKQRLNDILKRLCIASEDKISEGFNKTIPQEAIKASFKKEEYCELIKTVINYIREGDIFQANISQRFMVHLKNQLTPYQLYCKLRAINPAPFSAYLNFKELVIASASPERFIKLDEKTVEARPVKGTRPRGKDNKEDKMYAQALMQSEKDRCENVMIVDLMRNDLARACEDHSVKVSKLCGLESFRSVHHLVSVVNATLKHDLHATDLLKSTFPGGSVTGAPKIRAMQIIDELERNNRGPYCGSIGFIGFDGSMDTSITIRTFVIKDEIVTYQVGGAIVYDSNPEEEYLETLHKAKLLTQALTQKVSDAKSIVN
jgi:para-aminobenzoate synthetase component 1